MATAKKKSAKKTTKKSAVPPQRSFVRSKELTPFMTFRATHETAYWLIICLLILAVAAWVLSLTVSLHGIYDQIQTQSSSLYR